MISVCLITRGLVAYLLRKCGKKNYYFDGGEKLGIWLYTHATLHLEVFGEVRRKDLYRLAKGFNIHGEKLVRNAGKTEGRNARHICKQRSKTVARRGPA